jgi:hypothetical protein
LKTHLKEEVSQIINIVFLTYLPPHEIMTVDETQELPVEEDEDDRERKEFTIGDR